MAQRYTDPRARKRMDDGTCPECGETADEHSGRVEFWLRGPGCDLLPRGVTERIEQYRQDAATQAENDGSL
jgi:hypothetical protein